MGYIDPLQADVVGGYDLGDVKKTVSGYGAGTNPRAWPYKTTDNGSVRLSDLEVHLLGKHGDRQETVSHLDQMEDFTRLLRLLHFKIHMVSILKKGSPR